MCLLPESQLDVKGTQTSVESLSGIVEGLTNSATSVDTVATDVVFDPGVVDGSRLIEPHEYAVPATKELAISRQSNLLNDGEERRLVSIVCVCAFLMMFAS